MSSHPSGETLCISKMCSTNDVSVGTGPSVWAAPGACKVLWNLFRDSNGANVALTIFQWICFNGHWHHSHSQCCHQLKATGLNNTHCCQTPYTSWMSQPDIWENPKVNRHRKKDPNKSVFKLPFLLMICCSLFQSNVIPYYEKIPKHANKHRKMMNYPQAHFLVSHNACTYIWRSV